MRVLIADDHDLVRETLGAFLAREGDLACDGVASLPAALARIARVGRYDLVLLDYAMPGMDGLGGLRRALKANGEGTVAILTGHAPNQIAREALALGGAGFLTKSMPAKSLLSAVRFMLAGERYAPATLLAGHEPETEPMHPMLGNLTARERQALEALCRGLSNKEMARELSLHEATVKLHVRTLCRKLGARNRTQAALMGRDAGVNAAA